MTRLFEIRQILLGGGLTAITLSFVLDYMFATDAGPINVPEPNILSLLAVGGVVAVGLSVIRRRKK